MYSAALQNTHLTTLYNMPALDLLLKNVIIHHSKGVQSNIIGTYSFDCDAPHIKPKLLNI